jgi:hypothetical protein
MRSMTRQALDRDRDRGADRDRDSGRQSGGTGDSRQPRHLSRQTLDVNTVSKGLGMARGQQRQGQPTVTDSLAHLQNANGVVRNKAARAAMPAHECGHCSAHCDAMGLTGAQRKALCQTCSRHRTLGSQPPSTPEGYWQTEFSDSQTQE